MSRALAIFFSILLALSSPTLAAELLSPALRETEPGKTVTWIFKLEPGETLKGAAQEGFTLLSLPERKGPGYAPLTFQIPPDTPAGKHLVGMATVNGKTFELKAEVAFHPALELTALWEGKLLIVRVKALSNGPARYRLHVSQINWSRDRAPTLAPKEERHYIFRPPKSNTSLSVEAWVEGYRSRSLTRQVLDPRATSKKTLAKPPRLEGSVTASVSSSTHFGVGVSLSGRLSDYATTGLTLQYPWYGLFWLNDKENKDLNWNLRTGFHTDQLYASLQLLPNQSSISIAAGYSPDKGASLGISTTYRLGPFLSQAEYQGDTQGSWLIAGGTTYQRPLFSLTGKTVWSSSAETPSFLLSGAWRPPCCALRTTLYHSQSESKLSLSAAERRVYGGFSVGLQPNFSWRFWLGGRYQEWSGKSILDGEKGALWALGYKHTPFNASAGLRWETWSEPLELFTELRVHPLPFPLKKLTAKLKSIPAERSFSAAISSELAYPWEDGEGLGKLYLAWPFTNSKISAGYRMGDDLHSLESTITYSFSYGLGFQLRGILAREEGDRIEAYGRVSAQGLDLGLRGTWAFSTPVPDEIVKAFGGTRAGELIVCIQGQGAGWAEVALPELGAVKRVSVGKCITYQVYPGKWRVKLLALSEKFVLAQDTPREQTVRVKTQSQSKISFHVVEGGRIVGEVHGEEVPPHMYALLRDESGKEISVPVERGRFSVAPLLPGSYQITVPPPPLPGARVEPQIQEVALRPGEEAHVTFEILIERKGKEGGRRWRLEQLELPLETLPPGARVPARARVLGKAPDEINVRWKDRVLGVLRKTEDGAFAGWLTLPEVEGTIRIVLEGAGIKESHPLRLSAKAPWGVASGFGLLGPQGSEVQLLFFAPAKEIQVEAPPALAYESAPISEDRQRWKVRFWLREPEARGMFQVRIQAQLTNGKEARLGGILFVR